MADEPEPVLYHIPQTRSSSILWMLEEIGRPYCVHKLDVNANEHKSAAYLKINPAGKVPALAVGDVVVTERAAICLYLADRYALGTLAPPFDAPERAAYVRWFFFGTGVIEPLVTLRAAKADLALPPTMVGWGDWDTMLGILTDTLSRHPYLAGDRFTAVDVATGSMLDWCLRFDLLPRLEPLTAYVARLQERPALQRARAKDGSR